MVYHNYCMKLFAACMIFNDLVIKKAKYPKAFFNFFFPGLLEIGPFEMGEISTNLELYLFCLFNIEINSKIEARSSFTRKPAKCLSLGSNLPLFICDAVECNSDRTLDQRPCFSHSFSP